MIKSRLKLSRAALLLMLALGISAQFGCGDNTQLVDQSKDTGGGSQDPGDTPDAGGSEDTNEGNNPSDPQAPSGDFSTVGYSVKAGEALCERLFECGAEVDTLKARLSEDFKFADLQGCYDALSRAFYRAARPAVLSVEEQRQGHSAANAAACLDSVEQASCGQIAADLERFRFDGIFQPGGCDDIVIPGQALDDECLTPSECSDQETFCEDAAYSANGATLGTCQKLREEGDFCSRTFDCKEGLFCDFTEGECAALPQEDEPCSDFCGDTMLCEEDVCVPRKSEGADCGHDEDCAMGLACSYETDQCEPLAGVGESCEDLPCVAGASCESDDDSNLVCEAGAGIGEACASSSNCADGLVCAGNECAQADQLDQDCQGDSCAWYATCGSDGKCELLDPAVLDEDL